MRSVPLLFVFVILAQNGFGATINTLQFDGRVKPLIPRIFEDTLNDTLICVKTLLNVYYQTIDIEELNLNFDILGNEDLRGYFHVKNFRLTDISDFVATQMYGDLNILQLAYTLDSILLIRNITITMDYDIDFVILGVSAWGTGTFELVFTGITFDLLTTFTIPTLSFSNTAIVPHIGDFRGLITGFLHDEKHSELTTQLLNQMLPGWINDQAQELSDYLSPIIESVINDLLQNGGGGGEGGIELDNSFWDLVEQYCPPPVAPNSTV